MVKRLTLSLGLKISLVFVLLISSYAALIPMNLNIDFNTKISWIILGSVITILMAIYFIKPIFSFFKIDKDAIYEFYFNRIKSIPISEIKGMYFFDNTGTKTLAIFSEYERINLPYSGKFLKATIDYFIENNQEYISQRAYSHIISKGIDIKKNKEFILYSINQKGIKIEKSGKFIDWESVSDLEIQNINGINFFKIICSGNVIFSDYQTKGNLGLQRFLTEKIKKNV